MPPKLNIPFLNIPDRPIKSATQDHLPIADITNDMVIYKDGGAAIVMESTALNFGLLSDKEQDAVIAAYAALLNSLSFSIQLAVYSRRKDITNYMKYLDDAHKNTKNPKLANMIEGYKRFVNETIKKKNVLEKNFYVIIPLSPFELGVSKSIASATKKKGKLPFPKSYVLEKVTLTLIPRRDHLIRQIGRLGLKLKQLTTAELIKLYFDLYNTEFEEEIPNDNQ